MAPTLVATAGSASANAFATRQQFIDYCDTRLNASAGTSAAGADQDRALIEATRTLTLLDYEGYKTTTAQALAWPRSQALNPDSAYGLSWFGTSEIPQRIIDATCEYALAFLTAGTTDLASLDASETITEETVGPLTTKYADPWVRLRGLRKYPRVWGLVSPLLCGSSAMTTRVIRG